MANNITSGNLSPFFPQIPTELPEGSAENSSPKKRTKMELPSYRVLLDQKIMAGFLKNLNQTLVQTCPNGQEAIAYLENTRILPDIIISDRNMPVMDGIAFLNNINLDKKYDTIHRIFWSDDTASLPEKECEDLRINQFLLKPARKGDVEKAIAIFAQLTREIKSDGSCGAAE